MLEKFTFAVERDESGFYGTSTEFPAARGQGPTMDSCMQNLIEAVGLVRSEREPFLAIKTLPVRLASPGTTHAYDVKIIHSTEGFAVGCPALRGCWSQGATEEEALVNIRDAMKDYLEVADEMRREHESPLEKVA